MDMGRAAGRKPAASRVIKHRLLDFSLHGNCGEVFEMFRPRLIWLEITVDGDVPAITNAVVSKKSTGACKIRRSKRNGAHYSPLE